MEIKEIFIVSLIIVLCCSMTNFAIEKKNNDENDEILWSKSKKLVWEDFKGIPDTVGSIMLAETTSTIKFEYNVTNNVLTSYKIESIFIKSRSWTITNDMQLLAHEQLHFDITELYARKIRKAFDSLRIRKNFNEENYSLIYNSNILKRNDLNKLYDSQVYGNNIRQNQWIKRVKNEVLKLNKYESSY
ncbi:hypothetical protein [Flavobacterium collinsii]|uniref:DUF922 domain-containing protein n=1 Tax=Flavobacterium collinsii TaxID=1114861 RepID=A0A9W4TIJ3_9FLAO|nr:hypothetical protein [Flavobacterium collinsii]CAI2767896.1 conserved protein of unknown function [Flavobacterium collinsii]